jgi:hypothetical protein
LIRKVAYEESGRAHNNSVAQKMKWEDCTGRIAECRLGLADICLLTPTLFL